LPETIDCFGGTYKVGLRLIFIAMAKKPNKLKRTPGQLKKPAQVTRPPGVSYLQSLLQQALDHHRSGHLSQAEAFYRQILSEEPTHSEALHFLGMLAHQVGNSEIAVELISKALGCRPGYIDAHVNLGAILQDQGRLDEAISSFRQALALKPNYAEAHSNLGNALMDQGKLDEAVASFRQALAMKPDSAEVGYNLGNALKDQGKLDEAVASYRQALALKPGFADIHNNLGVTLNDQGKLDEAVASFRQALTLKPDFAGAHNNLGKALKDQGKLGEAIVSFQRAIMLKPDFAEAFSNLGNALMDQDKLDEAIACYRQALAWNPDYAEAHSNLGNALLAQNRLDKAISSYHLALVAKPDFPSAHSNLLLGLNYLPGQTDSQYYDEACRYGLTIARKVSRPFADWSCSSNPNRLRVGMVSGDFRNHPVGYFLENMLANLDPGKIQLIAYPTNRQEDELTARIRSRFVDWKPLQGMRDEAAAGLIHADGVHILLDLSGHTKDNRLPVFAWKPAPVQVSWLGYSASTGLAEMDYLLADPYVVPPGEDEYFTETIWRLPESYLCFSPPSVPVPVNSLPASKTGRITFGSFNNPTKMNDSVVELWAKVLHAVPDSRLFLKSERFSNPTIRGTTRQRFVAFGIPPERILLEGFVSQREEHLAAYNRIDIALDPFPYNGTTTSFEGLWMGVPFITLRGNRFISRVGASIAHNAGLVDWIAKDPGDYVAKARAHATGLEKLAALRTGLRRQVLESPLFDSARFARNFEEAMRGMWRRFQAER
jgi:predicted O-linked N-acetylglucosamine transferase (SPINDLY family)